MFKHLVVFFSPLHLVYVLRHEVNELEEKAAAKSVDEANEKNPKKTAATILE